MVIEWDIPGNSCDVFRICRDFLGISKDVCDYPDFIGIYVTL